MESTRWSAPNYEALAGVEASEQQSGEVTMSNLETAKRGYELFQRGDIQTLITDIVDDACQWNSTGPKDKLPWAGTYTGKQEIGKFFVQLDKHVEFTEFAPHDMIDKGDTVVVLGTFACRMKSTDKKAKIAWAHVLKYGSHGRLVFFQDYGDTAALVSAMS
jgi:uncharacterized protein